MLIVGWLGMGKSMLLMLIVGLSELMMGWVMLGGDGVEDARATTAADRLVKVGIVF